MASYQPFKTKSFKLKKDAVGFIRDFKKKNTTDMDKYKTETNYNANNPLPWEALIMKKM